MAVELYPYAAGYIRDQYAGVQHVPHDNIMYNTILTVRCVLGHRFQYDINPFNTLEKSMYAMYLPKQYQQQIKATHCSMKKNNPHYVLVDTDFLLSVVGLNVYHLVLVGAKNKGASIEASFLEHKAKAINILLDHFNTRCSQCSVFVR